MQYRHPQGRNECKEVFAIYCDGEGKFIVSYWLLAWGWLTCGTRTPTCTRSAAVWFARGSLLYVLLLDDHDAMHGFSLQVMRSAKYIVLVQICCAQLCCVAAVLYDNMCIMYVTVW